MKLSSTVVIRAPRADVFRVFSDIPNACERVSGIQQLEVLSEAKSGRGLRWRETRVMFGKEATEEMQITRFDQPSSYVVEAESHGTHYTSRFSFEEDGRDATRVTWEFVGKPVTTAAKLLSPLALLLKGPTERALKQDMLDLKSFLERPPPSEAAGARA